MKQKNCPTHSNPPAANPEASARILLWISFACGIVLTVAGLLGSGCHASRTAAPDGTQVPGELRLSGSDWRIVGLEPGQGEARRAYAEEGYPKQEAFPALVPGDIHWDLERNGVVPPIYQGTNSQTVGWVSAREWWYRKDFRLPAGWSGKTLRLQFDGVDYLADFWLNGAPLGRHEGQFTAFEFDIGNQAREGTNTLTVLVHPAPAGPRQAIAEGRHEWEVMPQIQAAYPYWKSMTTAGWDWGCKILTMGIWKDVRLVASEQIALASPVVLPELPPPFDRATLRTRIDIESPSAGACELHYRVRCLTAPARVLAGTHEAPLAPGRNVARFAIELNRPRLWWPNGYGEPHLYEMECVARAPGKTRPLATARTTFGIRDLQVLQNPLAGDMREFIDWRAGGARSRLPDPPPERRYLLQINGRRIFARGGNWIPCDLLYGRPRPENYEHLLRLAKEANYNLFRIWGGGLIEKSDFYDACDRHGIMLFHDFPNAGPRPLETDAALGIRAAETRQILPLLMNHPCVVRYAGGNEWYLDANTSRQMAQLRRLCNEIDPTRPFHDPDPEVLSQRHGPHGYEGDTTYTTYNTGQPLTGGPDNPLEWTEYGASGASSVETLKSILPEASLWPIRPSDPHWAWHKAFGAYGPDNWLASAQYRALFGELPDLKTTVRASQFVQAEGLRYANQAMRRFQWHRSACASWTYNEPWPNAAHGCIVEYSGRPKMAYYYTRQAYAPLDISAVYSSLRCAAGKPLHVDVWATHDGDQELTGCDYRARLFSLKGSLLAERQEPFRLAPETAAKIGALDWTPPPDTAGEAILLLLEVRDPAGAVAARNVYTFGIQGAGPAHPPPLAPLLQAPATAVNAHIANWNKASRSESRAVVTVRNTGAVPALFVELSAPAPAGQRVYWQDNYLFLLPGEARRIGVAVAASLPGKPATPTVRVQAWNSPVSHARDSFGNVR